MYSDFLNSGKDQASTSYGSIPNHAFDRPPGVDSLPISLREDNDDIESEWYMHGISFVPYFAEPDLHGLSHKALTPLLAADLFSVRRQNPTLHDGRRRAETRPSLVAQI